MSAKIIHLAQNNTHEMYQEALNVAVKRLANGELVVLPTETVYGIAVRADSPVAVQRLMDAKNRPESHPFALAVADTKSARKYVPQFGVLASRLARRCMPGPVTLVCDASLPQSAVHALPSETKKYVAPENSVGIRVPAHAFTLDVLENANFPVVLTSANLSGETDATSGEEVIRKLVDRVDVIFEDGECRYKKPSTVVRIMSEPEKIEVLREGVCSRADIRQMCEMQILFLCTGNTCRSPLGEVLAKKLLGEMAKMPPETLREHGVHVHSAGVSAYENMRASTFGILTAERQYGMDLSRHRARMVTAVMLRWADFLYAMTETHVRHAVKMYPEVTSRLRVLALPTGGIFDPFGGTLEVYQGVAAEIYAALRQEFSLPEFTRQLEVTLATKREF